MATYSLGVRLAWSTFQPSPALEIRTSPLANARLTEIGFANAQTNTVGQLGLGRPAAIGTSPVGLWQFQPDDPADAPALTQAATQWLGPPTAPAKFLRRISVATQTGMAFIWTSPKGIVIPAAASLVLWSLASGANASVGLGEAWAVIRE